MNKAPWETRVLFLCTFLVSARKVPKEADQRGATTADAPPLETPAALSDAFATEKVDFYSVFWYTKASPYPGEAFCVGTQGFVECFGKRGIYSYERLTLFGKMHIIGDVIMDKVG